MKNLRLRENNLYASGTVKAYNDGTVLLERKRIRYEGAITDRYHTVKQDDTLTYLAYMYYKNFTSDPAKYWWVIADVNDIINPLDISHLVGYDLLIPDINMVKLKD